MRPDNDVIRACEYEVKTVDLKLCQKMVEEFHYSKGGSNTAVYRHGMFLKGIEFCWGVAWWIPPTKNAAIASWDGDWQSVLSLSRLVVNPLLPQNAASFLIGRSIREIRKDERFKCLVSYADTWRNHSGAIYKATNWEDMGLTDPQPVWLDSNGRMMSRKIGPKTRTNKEMQALGYKMIGRFAKRKFRILL